MKSICIYCGSGFNGDPELKESVEKLASLFISKQINMVYGGGNVGLMGLISTAIMANGGTVTGVIPQFLFDQVPHIELTQLIITENMHQRKKNMADISDGFIILPGGLGTMEEFFEVLTWLQLGLHNKPIGVLNVGGYYDHLFAQMDVMVKQKFLRQENRDMVFNESDPEVLIAKMDQFNGITDELWFKERNLT
ncbi:Lysine decarboxylase family [Arcticibacter svalbardensis MN12-7]|uniref:Cytokinin riboside 5'-monophosphate phosphoribohydrolase n=1 Tax=Arcticibacter svalbardensis MN12-7 TaxID=1150600 RepID=R9GMY7_9SPHI|nr:TIGR00730 family Rossman fold protein [Arcticibacter svalbardensis]EOR93071.1 Lysine decarboxylase family [Arcticibacter svalbardensis MN12-7]